MSVFFSPGYNAPLWSSMPFVFVLHDLNHIDRPENSSWAKRVFYEKFFETGVLASTVRRDDLRVSRRRICDWSGVPQGRVVNVGAGVGKSYHRDVPAFQPGYEYILCVSNRRLHKNELRLVSAFAQASIPSATRLVFTGNPEPRLLSHIASLRVTDRTVFLGSVEEAKLPSLYAGARCLAFPSLYEGFGLPVLEAFACGTPVVTSNVSSLPEVAGDAALQVDPMSVPDMATALERALLDETLRERLRTMGLARAATFTWSKVAAKLETVLQGAASAA